MQKVVLVTGGFDPLHSGHIQYFKAASALGDKWALNLQKKILSAEIKAKFFLIQYASL